MNALEVLKIELNLIKYFNQFLNYDIKIIVAHNGNKINYNDDGFKFLQNKSFENFFQRKLVNNNNVSYKDFINNEKKDFTRDFEVLKGIVRFRIVEDWITFLDEKLKENIEEKPNEKVKENEVESQIETFNPEIFKDQRSFNLFLYLASEYATTKQPKQFSQIFYWMQENDNSIKPNKGVKYRKFVKNKFPEMTDIFARIEQKKPYEMTTLNEMLKQFNSMSKV